jgi:hypothetical protein
MNADETKCYGRKDVVVADCPSGSNWPDNYFTEVTEAATCAAPGQTCHDSVDGKPPLTCCGDSVCTQIIGGKQCQYPDTCAAPGETCYDSVDGKPPLTCCDGYECQQIIGGKRCASNREETTTAGL